MKKYFVTFKIGLQNALMYRGNMLAGFCTYAMFIFVFFYLWRAIYAGGSVEGLTLTQVVWYLCLTELISFGARVTVYSDISRDVKSGGIAYQLLRPYDYIGYQLSSALGPIIINMLMFGIVGVIMGAATVGFIPGWRLWTLAPSMLSMVCGITLYFFISMFIGLTAFFIEDPYGINLLFHKMVFMFGTFIPVEFLPDWLQSIAKAMPFSYVSWAPARLTVGFSWELFSKAFPIQLAYLIGFAALCKLLMTAGRKKISANGG